MKKEEVEILQNQIMREHEQYNDLVHDSIDDLKTIRTYKQALEEIREELNKIFVVCDDNCGNASRITKITNKINKVLQ